VTYFKTDPVAMKTLNDMSALLETARKQQKITYDELARAAGLTPLATRRALKAQTAPRITTLMALADRLGLELVIVPKVVAQGLSPAEPVAPRPLSSVDKLAAAGLRKPTRDDRA
jgi:transcriptional regulator with XRE-family HTH domain